MEWLRIIHASYYFLVVTASNTLFRQHSFDDVKTTHLEQIDLWTFFVVAKLSKASCIQVTRKISLKVSKSLETSLARRTMVTDGCFRSSSSQRTSAVSVKTFQTQCEWMKREIPLQYTFFFVQSMYKQLVDVDVSKFQNHECSATHEICQKFYMAGFLGQKLSAL